MVLIRSRYSETIIFSLDIAYLEVAFAAIHVLFRLLIADFSLFQDVSEL